MTYQRGFFFNVDWLTILIYLLLCSIGWFNIYSVVADEKTQSIIDLNTNYGKQLIFIISASFLATMILLIDSKLFRSFTHVFYITSILLLLVVLAIGRNVGGSQSWISFGLFRLQPSEFAKFSTCLLVARYLSETNVRISDFKPMMISMAIIGLPMVLIMMQPDTGSTLTFSALVLVLYREGLPIFFLLIGVLILVLSILLLLVNQWYVIMGLFISTIVLIGPFSKNKKLIVALVTGLVIAIGFVFSFEFMYNRMLEPHQRARINELVGLSSDPKGSGYNVNQSKIAIGSGKLWGKGYRKGTQTRYAFIPEQSTDFIFCTIGEEWGFVGCTVIIALYLALLLRITYLAERQRSAFSRIYGYGVASILFFHFFINIGMTIGLVPVIGIPLPFISYGGSSLWGFTILLFTLLKLDANRYGRYTNCLTGS